ncbi:Hydrocephalus-inducing, partial [Lonchura striata]
MPESRLQTRLKDQCVNPMKRKRKQMPKEQKSPNMSQQITKKLTGQSHVVGLLPSKFLREKFVSTKSSTGGSILPRIGPSRDWQNDHFISFLQFPQLVKIYMESSPYFQLMCSNNVYRVVTPGVPAHVHIRFTPDENKGAEQRLLCFVPGEESIQTNLHGQAVDLKIGLSTNSVDVGKTFIGMSNHTTVFIENRSNITAHFQWKTLPTEEYENEEKRRQYLLRCRKAVCLENFTEERKTEKGSCKDHTSLLRNVVQEEMAKIQEDPMLFSSAIFCIEPLEGEIQPYSWAEIKVTFKPLEALEYQIMAYCNISGRESRLPLHLRGEGQGPLVELSCPSVNLGNILVNNPHICEVKLINQGAINAPFTCIPSTTNVGFFKFAPEEGIITPGEIQTIQISFSATVLGRFEEEVRFSVAGSPVPAILTIKGNVTRPTLHFELDELSFGDISFGFPYTQSCHLTNTTSVPVTFKLRVLDDGMQPAVNVFDQIHSHSDPSWREGIRFYVEPKEFTMNPSQGTILPQGHQDIEVWEEPSHRCFSTRAEASLECGRALALERKEDSPVFYSSHKPCGIVQPHSTAEIPVTIEVQTVGKHRTNLLIGVFGDERNPL